MTDPKSAQPGPAMAMSALTSLNKSVDAMNQLREDVRAGRVKLDPAAGAQLKKALTEQEARAAGWRESATQLEQALPLGEHWVGQLMADKMSKRASGTQFSFSEQIKLYIDELQKAQVVLDEAIKATTGADSSSATDLRKQK
ncbi:hypothetical protein [Crossiella cryophila]|uniref:Uncharacterized protein n=1 Tax=Crossiella cryophila TaxID=43355 RepID=A0A7W7FQA0_9PSEU|nr:hypothetical protein [Crossiella cryophila]MBB4674706.1 hypothetical protein [Crossiella cryophila]